ncbi:type II toxin-antitoxin system prevent-host-death family antitoxin [Chlorogloea sp. CCALA 695]|uniref:type II toxin-antitoxin system prevent-host-death family antitoxin n=1 Tax=Chlorogloea sp. CCALA 695 TaxID=2107693 RepID=UPI000D085DE8|nr:type II toxin-antitoxin system prevent-host-death family antitoxin [Chlorogloea sp. CCALA 695]PSB35504.1 prevent-host-death family protein [Chlorogloea sp. CCALA 695]
MSQQYPIEQISFNFDKILQEVEQGEPIQISWQGKQVAVMLSASEYERLLTKQVGFWESVQQFRQEYEVEKADIDPDVVFGDVRDKSPGSEVIF